MNESKFTISDEVQFKHPQLVNLIKDTESMDDNEKQYWFDIMPTMSDDQVDLLFTILLNESDKLRELEAKYRDEIRAMNAKHLIEWQEFQSKVKSDNPVPNEG